MKKLIKTFNNMTSIDCYYDLRMGISLTKNDLMTYYKLNIKLNCFGSNLFQIRLNAVDERHSLVNGVQESRLFFRRSRRERLRRQSRNVGNDRIVVLRRHSRKRRNAEQQCSLLKFTMGYVVFNCDNEHFILSCLNVC
jgi:hypothetical protein